MRKHAPSPNELELAALHASGRQYWRSLAEAARTEDAGTPPGGEFPAPWTDDVDRRHFLKLMGASLALAGAAGCTREPVREIVPYVKQPPELTPGRPQHYATAMSHNGFATGILVRSNEGHPTKIEGNPTHPASLGATGIFPQAALLNLYDPDRAKTVTNAGDISTFPRFTSALNDALAGSRARHGAGLRVLTPSVTSPALIAQLEELLRQFPEARWHQYQPVARDNTLAGARLVFDRAVETRHRFDEARVILSLGADFLSSHPFQLAYTRQFANGRRTSAGSRMSRVYVVESTPSLTGSVADHRLPVSAAEIENLAFALASELGVGGAAKAPPLPETQRRWIAAVAVDLRENAGACVIITGEEQPASVHALTHLINDHLGNIGHTVEYTDSAETHWIDQAESLRQLVREMESGSVDCLLILGGNPVFDAPADLQFGKHLDRVKFRAHLSPGMDETSVDCDWHIAESHFLESWGDARSFDGTISIIQPLISPLYDTKSALEILDAITRKESRSDYDIVREYWRKQNLWADFESSWRQALHDGLIAGTQLPPIKISPHAGVSIPPTARINKSGALEICFRPDPCVGDGAFANNGWLQELPKPFSKVTWDNPALISPALAREWKLANGDMVELHFQNHRLEMPIWIMPGQAENTVTVHFGLGRSRVGETGRNVGFNAYGLRTSDARWFGAGLELTRIGKNHSLATTQQTHSIEGRDIIRDGTLAEFLTGDFFARKKYEPAPAREDTLYNPDEFKNPGPAWAMAINLNACIGCSACAIACQAENNIPVVGREQVSLGRDMAWIRIDQYFQGGLENPRVSHQPVPCMHCENAPCELVCPVGATVHDHEGLNLQVYNRCVGTRYCSNNCPYKVRRFNFFRYADYETPSLKAMRNPNVTVRWRGVMEKCTYCIQRISAARISAGIANQPIRDGEIKTACQQVCPAEAITFGNINDPASAVTKLKASPLNYAMLGELNARPRTTYLARLRNPNPALEATA